MNTFQTFYEVYDYAKEHKHIFIKTVNNLTIYCFGTKFFNTYKDVVVLDINNEGNFYVLQKYEKIKINPKQIVFSNKVNI